MTTNVHSTIILAVVLVTYTFYTGTFILCFAMLLRKQMAFYKLHLISITTLFACITIAEAIFIARKSSMALNYVYNTAALIAHIVGDVILVWRCYFVWAKNWKIIMVPCIQLAVSVAFGILRLVVASGNTFQLDNIQAPKEEGFSLVLVSLIGFYATSLVANIVLTSLTAGRIFWIVRSERSFYDHTNRSQYSTAIAILVESGAIYSISLLAVILCFAIGAAGNRTPQLDLALGIVVPLSLQCSGLMPTLILVRSALAARIRSVLAARSVPKVTTIGSSRERTQSKSGKSTDPPMHFQVPLESALESGSVVELEMTGMKVARVA